MEKNSVLLKIKFKLCLSDLCFPIFTLFAKVFLAPTKQQQKTKLKKFVPVFITFP